MTDTRPGEPEPDGDDWSPPASDPTPEAEPARPHDALDPEADAAEELESEALESDVADGEADEHETEESAPVTFERQQLASTVRWVWLGGYLVPVAILSLIAAQLDVLVLETAGGLVTSVTVVTTVALAVWRTVTRYRAWSWELTERQLIIDRGVVFELTRIVPRVRIQHVDISSGPLDRFFGLRQLSIYTAGTREADASIPGLTADRAEELRAALIGS